MRSVGRIHPYGGYVSTRSLSRNFPCRDIELQSNQILRCLPPSPKAEDDLKKTSFALRRERMNRTQARDYYLSSLVMLSSEAPKGSANVSQTKQLTRASDSFSRLTTTVRTTEKCFDRSVNKSLTSVFNVVCVPRPTNFLLRFQGVDILS